MTRCLCVCLCVCLSTFACHPAYRLVISLQVTFVARFFWNSVGCFLMLGPRFLSKKGHVGHLETKWRPIFVRNRQIWAVWLGVITLQGAFIARSFSNFAGCFLMLAPRFLSNLGRVGHLETKFRPKETENFYSNFHRLWLGFRSTGYILLIVPSSNQWNAN